MKNPRYRVNDYVRIKVDGESKVGRIVGVVDNGSFNEYEVKWWVKLDDSAEWNAEFSAVSFSEVSPIDLNASLIKSLGFKKTESGTYRCETDNRHIVVMDWADNSVVVYRHGNKIVRDYFYADYLADLQHLFEDIDAEFPDLDIYFALQK